MEKDLYNSLIKIKDKPFILLEAAREEKEEQQTFLFDRFEEIIHLYPGDSIGDFFRKIESYLDKGYWVAGYFTYEFGYFFEPELFKHFDHKEPLAWVGVCKNPKTYKAQKVKYAQNNKHFYEIKNIHPNIDGKEYSAGIKKIKKHLGEGNTYQVNYTFKMKFDFKGDPLGMYLDLRRVQPTSYLGLINIGQEKILSFSPELFFKIDKGKITSKPMKGTLSRGASLEKEKEGIEKFKKNEKIRAENIMIVDLLRNDIGRISKKVDTESLFNIEKHNTLYQMTSTINGKLRKKISMCDIFAALFPCGSVTGAPKIRTMQITQELEKEPRGIYTGAIGYISPERKACFNVAIRTAVIRGNQGELGVGGGIVYDSDEQEEYKEALLKAKFLIQGDIPFSLIETIKWDKNKGYVFLKEHLRRLQSSCQYFSIPLNIQNLRNSLSKYEKGFKEDTRVRVLIDKDAEIVIEHQPLLTIKTPHKIMISSKRVDKNNIFLYHKTTQRNLYESELEKARNKGFLEVIFLNQNGEITEGSFTNIFIEKNGQLFTPPIRSGLLNGIYRQHLLQQHIAQERVMTINDLKIANKIYVCNSLRGLIEVEFTGKEILGDTVGVEKALSL
jgi:para-aminobenzoate synthetase/4-amino-4-deoxychorismate lyase